MNGYILMRGQSTVWSVVYFPICYECYGRPMFSIKSLFVYMAVRAVFECARTAVLRLNNFNLNVFSIPCVFLFAFILYYCCYGFILHRFNKWNLFNTKIF